LAKFVIRQLVGICSPTGRPSWGERGGGVGGVQEVERVGDCVPSGSLMSLHSVQCSGARLAELGVAKRDSEGRAQ
jgi:hypothetical protein